MVRGMRLQHKHMYADYAADSKNQSHSSHHSSRIPAAFQPFPQPYHNVIYSTSLTTWRVVTRALSLSTLNALPGLSVKNPLKTQRL